MNENRIADPKIKGSARKGYLCYFYFYSDGDVDATEGIEGRIDKDGQYLVCERGDHFLQLCHK